MMSRGPMGFNSAAVAITARWVLPISGSPIENGVVLIQDGEIKNVCQRQNYNVDWNARLKDYGEAIISPGFINLHTHLDYSSLRLVDTDSCLLPWIRKLTGQSSAWGVEQWQRSALSGASSVALSGTTCVIDSSFSGAAAWALAQLGLRGVVALELFGVGEMTSNTVWQSWLARRERLILAADSHLEDSLSRNIIQLTVSPHAPYTVCPRLWERALEWAEHNDQLVCSHLAESKAESRWIAHGDPAMDDFLIDMAPAYASELSRGLTWKGIGLSPVMHLDRHGLLTNRLLAAHAVNVSPQDITTLAEANVKVAHCPRSNTRLRNGIAPWKELVQAGVTAGFGTDSFASVDDLSVLSEARFAWNLHRAVDPEFAGTAEEAVHLLTLGAAEISNLSHLVGSLSPGKRADIAVFSLAADSATTSSNPYNLLFYGDTALSDLYVDGQPVVEQGTLTKLNRVEILID